MPKDNPEKWEQFKEYCKQDVEAERAIRKRIEKYAGTTERERHLRRLDRTINGNGVWIDMDLVDKVIRIDDLINTALYRKGELLTGGLNLNSNQQMLKWIEALFIAWLEDEEWRMEVFVNGDDIYCANASGIFGGVSTLKAFGADKMGLTICRQ